MLTAVMLVLMLIGLVRVIVASVRGVRAFIRVMGRLIGAVRIAYTNLEQTTPRKPAKT